MKSILKITYYIVKNPNCKEKLKGKSKNYVKITLLMQKINFDKLQSRFFSMHLYNFIFLFKMSPFTPDIV